jgi:prepilin-type N-terminal cleavage/methylation domain-containing protein/prepilin-type processing-associated H-X9-DG protein
VESSSANAKSKGNGDAFTLLELLVVVALIGMLIGLTLSAIQKVRAAAARTQCQNNLKQIGLALHHYHDTTSQFPPGVSGERSGEPMPFVSWCARLLPYLEEEALWRQVASAFQSDKNFLHDPPHTGLHTAVRQLICPSDARIRRAQPVGTSLQSRAFTSYLGVNGYNAFRQDGVFFVDSRTRLGDITDGASNTLAVGERPPSKDLILGWWYAGWGQDKDGEGDMLLGVRTRNNTSYGKGCPDGPYEFKEGKFDDQCDAFHFWSPHSGGANFGLADGSVRFLRYSANAIMPALASRAGGEAESVP